MNSRGISGRQHTHHLFSIYNWHALRTHATRRLWPGALVLRHAHRAWRDNNRAWQKNRHNSSLLLSFINRTQCDSIIAAAFLRMTRVEQGALVSKIRWLKDVTGERGLERHRRGDKSMRQT